MVFHHWRDGDGLGLFATSQQNDAQQQREQICQFHVGSLPDAPEFFNKTAPPQIRRKKPQTIRSGHRNSPTEKGKPPAARQPDVGYLAAG
jgi:hypothetical protein